MNVFNPGGHTLTGLAKAGAGAAGADDRGMSRGNLRQRREHVAHS